jgi:hypothetical protein
MPPGRELMWLPMASQVTPRHTGNIDVSPRFVAPQAQKSSASACLSRPDVASAGGRRLVRRRLCSHEGQ